MSQSNGTTTTSKPKKPSKTFPLFAHSNGKWAKKIRQRHHYFTSWRDDPKGVAALEQYNQQAADLHAGRRPRAVQPDELTLADLCNRFLTAKQRRRDAGRLGKRTFADYHAVCGILINAFGRDRAVEDLRPDDFEQLAAWMGKRKWSPKTILNFITRSKSVFGYGFKQGLIDRPVRYGEGFEPPSQTEQRVHREQKIQRYGRRDFDASEIRSMIDAANPLMKAAILLAINGGLGNKDIASLPKGVIDFKGGWLNYGRLKTGIPRRIPLWPETLKALREALEARVPHRFDDDAELVFIGPKGFRLVKTGPKGGNDDQLSKTFTKMTRDLGITRKGVGFYGLRRTFQTIADGANRPVATSSIMGHVDGTMAGIYRQRVADDDLRAVTDHVRRWLYGK